jgi:hypothetical protein
LILSYSTGSRLKAKSEFSALEQNPFPVRTSHGRKYVRIQLSSPVQFRLLTCKKGRMQVSKAPTCGEILNLSEGGMLFFTDSFVPQEGFVLLTLNLNKLVILDGVLGKIKRVEPSKEGDFLVGVEFTSREELEKLVSFEQIERLPVKVASFSRKLSEIISGFLRSADLGATK